MSTRVETSNGYLEGTREGELCVFRGIPFARPPLGPLRFRAPQQLAPWAGVRAATQFSPAAAQNASLLGPLFGMDMGPTSEDCLYLNLWTPAADGGRRPVLVWIHGGAFTIGSGGQPLYDGGSLARRGDVVVVTINYRLGAFGFLRLADLTGDALPSSGNEGLLDQIAALEWVRDEIAAFGGDPGNVTIFGESAGSISVATLLGTPQARGLFHRAILQSGSANLASSMAHAQDVAETVLQELGMTPHQAAAALQEIPAARLLEAQQAAFMKLQSRVRGLTFAPVVDGDILPRHPFTAIADGCVGEVPVLIGTNLDEWKLFGLADSQVRSLDDAALIRRCERNMPSTDGERTAQSRAAVATYRDARAARGWSAATPDLWFAIESDRVFRYPAMRLAELQSRHAPTYAYLFTWPSPFMEGVLGACHALEIPFVFGTLHDPLIGRLAGVGPVAAALAERMQDEWLHFARTGAPASGGAWPAYEPAQRATMLFGADCGSEMRPMEAERQFWDFWDGTL